MLDGRRQVTRPRSPSATIAISRAPIRPALPRLDVVAETGLPDMTQPKFDPRPSSSCLRRLGIFRLADLDREAIAAISITGST